MKIKTMHIWILILCACLLLPSCSQEEYLSTNEDDYRIYVQEVYQAELHMPSLKELGEYKEICITRRLPQGVFAKTTSSIALIVQYEASEFYKALDYVYSQYIFLSCANDQIWDIEAQLNYYNFYIVSKPTSNEWNKSYYNYPHAFMMIGVDKNEFKIAYLFHYDSELDRIKNLDEFICDSYLLT